MNETLLKDTPELDTAPERDHRPARPLPSYRPLPQRTEDSESHRQRNPDSESGDPPQLSRLRNRLERLRNQVLPCVSRDVLEKAYRVLDESDPEKVQVISNLVSYIWELLSVQLLSIHVIFKDVLYLPPNFLLVSTNNMRR